MEGCSLSWGPIQQSENSLRASSSSSSSPSSSPVIYLVVGQDQAGQWYEVTQTVTTSTVLEGTMTAKLAKLVVLGLTESGLQDTVIMDTDGTNCDLMEMSRSPDEAETEEVEASLTPRVVSLQYDDQSLTSVRLSWEGELGQFLVTWQRLTSGLTSGLDIVGNLVTSHTSVPLSLQSNSVYLFTIRDLRGNTVSPDTHICT